MIRPIMRAPLWMIGRRAQLAIVLGNRCGYCGRALTFNRSRTRRATDEVLDHVVPRCSGGRDHPSNMMLCCISCNTSKKQRSLEEWRDWLTPLAPTGQAGPKHQFFFETVDPTLLPRQAA